MPDLPDPIGFALVALGVGAVLALIYRPWRAAAAMSKAVSIRRAVHARDEFQRTYPWPPPEMASETVAEQCLDLLSRCLAASDPTEREFLIKQFQGRVWPSEGVSGDARVDDILATAAMDLEYYEPRPDARAEDGSFYDDAELDRRLRAILRELGQPAASIT